MRAKVGVCCGLSGKMRGGFVFIKANWAYCRDEASIANNKRI